MRDRRVAEGAAIEDAWEGAMQQYRDKYPVEAMELDLIRSGALPEGWQAGLPRFSEADANATRKHGHTVRRSQPVLYICLAAGLRLV